MRIAIICAFAMLTLYGCLGGCAPDDYTPPVYKPKAGALLPQCAPDSEECKKTDAGLGMRLDGGMGVNLGGGLILGFDGKTGFGFGF